MRHGRGPGPVSPAAPTVSPSQTRALLLLLAVLTVCFALYQLFMFGIALRVHNWPLAAMYLVMGIAGLAIASALRSRTRR